MSNISIETNEVKNKAELMKSKADTIKNILEDVTKKTNEIPSSLKGKAADSFMNQYNNLKSNFSNFYDKIIEHANLLINAANSYDEADKSLEKKAEEFLN